MKKASTQPLQNTHVIRHCRAAHIKDTAETLWFGGNPGVPAILENSGKARKRLNLDERYLRTKMNNVYIVRFGAPF